MVGFYREPRLEGDRVRATLHIFSSADWLWSLVQEAVEMGRPDVLGLSIDSLASVRTQQQNGKSTQVVERIPVLRSCDVVSRAAAGGAFERVLAAQEISSTDKENAMQGDQRTDTANVKPHAGAESTDSPHTEEVLMEDTATMTVDARLAEAEAKLACMTALHERLDTAALPAAIKGKLRRRFEGQTFTTAVLEQAVQDEVETVRALTGLCARRTGRGRGEGAHQHGRHRSKPGIGRGRGRLGATLGRAGTLPPKSLFLRGPAFGRHTCRSRAIPKSRGALNPELSVVREANEVTTSVLNHAPRQRHYEASRPGLRRAAPGLEEILRDPLDSRLQAPVPGAAA